LFLLHSAPLTALLTLTACPAGDDAETGADTESTSGAESSATTDPTAADSTADESTSGPPAPDVDGEEFFLSVCAPCHGPEGEGTALGYALQHPVRGYSTWVVRNGRPPGNPELPGSVMAAYAPSTVSDGTLEGVWDYLDSFPQPTTGEGLFLDYCRNCHGVDALGGATGVNITEQSAPDIFDKVREGESVDYSMRSLYMPAFDATRLSDAEVQLVIDHIASL
jgi:mono/diheme cytochrome c family protein